jgi:hypothetical protein
LARNARLAVQYRAATEGCATIYFGAKLLIDKAMKQALFVGRTTTRLSSTLSLSEPFGREPFGSELKAELLRVERLKAELLRVERLKAELLRPKGARRSPGPPICYSSGNKIVDPVVLRASRSRWACAASDSG